MTAAAATFPNGNSLAGTLTRAAGRGLTVRGRGGRSEELVVGLGRTRPSEGRASAAADRAVVIGLGNEYVALDEGSAVPNDAGRSFSTGCGFGGGGAGAVAFGPADAAAF